MALLFICLFIMLPFVNVVSSSSSQASAEQSHLNGAKPHTSNQCTYPTAVKQCGMRGEKNGFRRKEKKMVPQALHSLK